MYAYIYISCLHLNLLLKASLLSHWEMPGKDSQAPANTTMLMCWGGECNSGSAESKLFSESVNSVLTKAHLILPISSKRTSQGGITFYTGMEKISLRIPTSLNILHIHYLSAEWRDDRSPWMDERNENQVQTSLEGFKVRLKGALLNPTCCLI